MKKKMLLAFCYCIALSTGLKAQNAFNDTVSITPLPGTKILFIGKEMQRLVKENNFELLKNQFISDMKASTNDKDFPTEPEEAIYLVSADGRRRLKAKPEELVPFDPQKEITAFSNNLPAVHYTIYDLKNAFEYHIYLKEPQQLYQLAAINFSTVSFAIESKVKNAKRHTKVDLEPEGKDWQVTAAPGNKSDLLELYPSFGIGSFNSIISPGLGVHIDMVFLDKHRLPRYKLGSGITFYALGEYQDLQFKNVYAATSVDLRLLANIAPGNVRPVWLGLLAGRLRTGNIEDSAGKRPSLHKRFKLGVAAEIGSVSLEYAFIPATSTQSSLRNITFRFRF